MFPGNPHRLQLPAENKMPSATVLYLPFPFFFREGGGGGRVRLHVGQGSSYRKPQFNDFVEKQPIVISRDGWWLFFFFFVVWRRATQHFGIGTMTVNNIWALMSTWSCSTLHRSVHSYSTLFLKHGGQISVEQGYQTGNSCHKHFQLQDAFKWLIRDKEDKADL